MCRIICNVGIVCIIQCTAGEFFYRIIHIIHVLYNRINGINGIIGIKLVNVHCRTGSAQVVLLESPRQDQDIYFKTPRSYTGQENTATRCYSESGQ